jgi:hypothetical protein
MDRTLVHFILPFTIAEEGTYNVRVDDTNRDLVRFIINLLIVRHIYNPSYR